MTTTPIAQGPVHCEVRALPQQHPGQARTMLICETKNTVPAEVGHWYSPEKVAELIAAEREACAKIAETPVAGEQDDITMEAKDRIAVAIRARSNAESSRAAKKLTPNAKLTGD